MVWSSTFELDSGARVRIDPRSLSPTPGILRASRLGWADSTLFPDAYVPAEPAAWIGARVTMTSLFTRWQRFV